MLNVVDTLEAIFSRNYRVFINVSSFLFIIYKSYFFGNSL